MSFHIIAPTLNVEVAVIPCTLNGTVYYSITQGSAWNAERKEGKKETKIDTNNCSVTFE